MFKNVGELVELAQKTHKKIYELMIDYEIQESGEPYDEVYGKMRERYEVMKRAIARGIEGVTSHSGFTGGDAKRLFDYMEGGKYLTSEAYLKAAAYAIATNEVNAAMGIICATPTAGSSGVLPGVLIAVQEKHDFSDEQIINAMFTAGAFGYVLANNASISGAAGGCQAEIGSASGMAAGALTELLGGSPEQSANAMAMALKNMLGLACDPLGGLVEVPCIKRNAAGATNAILATELALAGIYTRVPWDEVIRAQLEIGQMMHVSLRETATGGLAASKTGKEWKKKLREKQ